MRPRGRQSQELLYQVVYHELGRYDHSDVNQSCLRPTEELGDAAVSVNAPDHRSESSGFSRGRSRRTGVVGLGQYHVPGLAAQAGRDAGTKGAQQRNDPLQLVRRERLRDRLGDRIQELGDEIEANLLSKGVRDLFRQHRPDTRHHDEEAVVADDPRQSTRNSLVAVGRVRHLLDPQGFHRHQQDGGDRPGDETRQGKGQDLAGVSQQRGKDRLGDLVGTEFHGPLDAISQDGGSQSVEEGGRTTLVLVGTNLERRADQSLAIVFFWIRLQFCLDDIDRCRDPVGKCGAGSTRDKVSIVHGLQGLESRRRRRGPPGGHGRVDERPGGTSRCADRQGHRCHRERSFRDRGLSLSLFVLLFILPPPVLPMPAFCCACWRCVHFGFVVSLSCFVSSRLVSFRFVSSRFVSFRCQQNT
mmetsp:Transcript_14291/g.32075  ORF Transcript_14291/g.32075 Transcript_14291/m.32075 type:complete len:414 (+) Transcript_14291:149-1390(+)